MTSVCSFTPRARQATRGLSRNYLLAPLLDYGERSHRSSSTAVEGPFTPRSFRDICRPRSSDHITCIRHGEERRNAGGIRIRTRSVAAFCGGSRPRARCRGAAARRGSRRHARADRTRGACTGEGRFLSPPRPSANDGLCQLHPADGSAGARTFEAYTTRSMWSAASVTESVTRAARSSLSSAVPSRNIVSKMKSSILCQ